MASQTSKKSTKKTTAKTPEPPNPATTEQDPPVQEQQIRAENTGDTQTPPATTDPTPQSSAEQPTRALDAPAAEKPREDAFTCPKCRQVGCPATGGSQRVGKIRFRYRQCANAGCRFRFKTRTHIETQAEEICG